MSMDILLGDTMREKSEIKVVVDGNICRIDFIGIVGINEWQRDAAKLQNAINEKNYLQIFIGFEQCKGCIAIAIVTLFLSIARNQGKHINIYISSDENDEIGSVYEMFSSMKIDDLCEILGVSLYLDGEEWLKKKRYIGNQECSPLMIFDVMKKSVEDIVEEVFNEINWSSVNSYDVDIKVKNILFETIANIRDHAYQDEEKAYAGVLFRRCKGFALESKYECRNTVKQLYANRNREYYEQIEYYYEIIVCDEGVGLTTSLGIRNMDGSKTMYPFSESIKRTFIEGKRGNSSEQFKSYYSGLNLVFKLLSENADYVYGMEGKELIDLLCTGNSPLGRHKLDTAYEFKGVSWMFHVAVNRSNDLGFCSVSGSYNDKGKNKILLANCKKRHEIDKNSFQNIYIIDERQTFQNIKNSFYERDERNKARIVWFHDAVRSKNNILNKISIILKSASEDTILLIGDVEESELSTYFCALDKWSSPSVINCNKIIVVSKHLRVQMYVRDGVSRIFKYDRSKAITYQESNAVDPFEAMLGYHNLIMEYDSSLLWSRIFEKKKKNYLVVRGDISWEDYPISYYLNLEMILADRELYEIIKHDLLRVSGFLEGECYFKSTDIVMKKLCIDINYYKKETDKSKNIYVESVYVTGKTDEVIETKAQDLKICIFVNYFDVPIDNTNVYSLFLWPEREIIDKNIKCWKQKLCRRAETHSLTAANKLSPFEFEKKRKNNCNFQRDYDETKQDMKELYGDFVRLGHFNYHNNHDLFSLNQREIIKTSAYEYRGVFLHALTLFMNTVGAGFFDNLQSEWKERLSDDNLGNGIFVYRMHYYTNFLFELIDSCFIERNCNIWECVVPIEAIEKKSHQQPLLISDMVLFHLVDLIKEKVGSFGECRIVIFDTMNVSGKTMRDMRRIVQYATKIARKELKKRSEEIKIEIAEHVLFDCETQHYDINARGIPAYYHFDIPRLGTKENCFLCSLIEKCNESKRLLNSTYAKRRVDSWMRAWAAVSPVYYKGVGGVDKSKVEDNGEFCEDFFSFATQLVEIACANGNRNYLFEYCVNNEKLSAEQKMYLLSFQIILFSQKDNYKEYNNVYTELFKQLNSVNTTSNATALAAMIGIQANEKTIHIAMSSLNNERKYLANEDIKIMFAIQCGKYKSLQDIDYYGAIFDLLNLSTKVDLDLLKGLHSQLYNVNGDMHSTRFDKLIKPFGETQLLNNHCDAVYYCLEYLYAIVGALNPLLIRADDQVNSFHPNQQREKDEVLMAIDGGKVFLEEVKRTVGESQREALLPHEKQKFEEIVLCPFENFHRKLFIPYGKKTGDFGKPILDEIMNIMSAASKYSYSKMNDEDKKNLRGGVEEDNNRVFFYYDYEKNRELRFFLEDHKKPKQIGGQKSELWYLWNQYVVEELYYLFGDIRHCDGVVDHRTHRNTLNMFVSFTVDEEKLVILFNSISSKTAEEIENLVTAKHRYQREAISKLGVSIKYTSSEKGSGHYYLTTEMSIPSIC